MPHHCLPLALGRDSILKPKQHTLHDPREVENIDKPGVPEVLTVGIAPRGVGGHLGLQVKDLVGQTHRRQDQKHHTEIPQQ